MSKRSADEKIERYLRKIDKLKKKRRLMSLTLSSSDSEPDNNNTCEVQTEVQEETFLNTEEPEIIPTEEYIAQSNDQPVEARGSEEPTDTPITEDVSSNPDLDPHILAALGDIVDDSPDFGEKIHDSLAKLWTPLLKKGMSKESREKMCKDYLIPENCPLLKSPVLNPEIMAATPETGRFRDKKMSVWQQQLGVGITAVNRGLNKLLTSDQKIEAIKAISDGCRLLSDLHFQQTETRKKFITPSLDKPFLQLIQVAERDDTLFGNNLSEKIKASKAIVTQSQQIKKNVVATKPSTSQPVNRLNSQGNWQSSPRFSQNRGGRGGFKKTYQRVQQPPFSAIQTQSHPRAAYQPRTRGTARHPHQQQ